MTSKLNREWHLKHKMPKNPSHEQRLEWHLAHALNCSCREMPDEIRRELEARGLLGPTVRSLR
jgi:hypothetical protein